MPNKNLTDAEIIKTLECCTTNGASCKDCPAFVKVDRSNCKKYFRGALDLINRQKAEIERLNSRKEVVVPSMRLIDGNPLNGFNLESHRCVARTIEDVKAEAHKELLQMLRREVLMCGEVNIEEFLEKLVGENNGD